jgi:hypothetical protein
LVALGAIVFLAPARAGATEPADEIVCRAKSSSEGTFELALHWQGSAAKGSLRQIAPSGNVTTQTVHAERHDGMIIADDIHEKDLVVHAAVVQSQHGKNYMRTGSDRPWLVCE